MPEEIHKSSTVPDTRGAEALVALSRFIAHDVTTSLKFGRLNLTHLERALESGSIEAVHNHLNSLRARIDGAELILERVKDLGRSVEFESSPSPVDLRVLAGQLERLVIERGFQFEWEGPALQIVTARDSLHLVLTELLRNALDHHDHPPGIVRLSWIDQGNHIEFRVADDGPGIPAEQQSRIFRFGATVGPRNVYRHAGLGLSIVAHLLTTLGQTYGILSNDAASRGTTLMITWPTRWPFDEGRAIPRD